VRYGIQNGIIGGIGKADNKADRRKGWSFVNLAYLKIGVQYPDVLLL